MSLFNEYLEKYREMIKEKNEYFFVPRYWIASQYLADRDISATDIDEIIISFQNIVLF